MNREQATEQITVVVRNDLRPATAVTVRLLSEGGARHLLGNVPPQATRTLTVQLASVAGSYHLETQAADGRELLSRTFSPFPYSTVQWRLFNNTLSVDAP